MKLVLSGSNGPMVLGWAALEGQTGHDAAWALLATLYREQTGEVLPEVLRAPEGKPYFPGRSWHFSLSHTKTHAFCLLARENVGLDAERRDRHINLKLADKILSPGEKRQFDTAENKKEALLRFWVLKEARGKFTGKGIRGYPNDTSFSLEDERVMEIEGHLVAVVN